MRFDAIKDAMDKSTGRDRDAAVTLADEYVAAHPEEFDEFRGLDIEALVNAVGVLRQAGLEEAQWRVETWLLHKYEPQNIGGNIRARVRMTGLG